MLYSLLDMELTITYLIGSLKIPGESYGGTVATLRLLWKVTGVDSQMAHYWPSKRMLQSRNTPSKLLRSHPSKELGTSLRRSWLFCHLGNQANSAVNELEKKVWRSVCSSWYFDGWFHPCATETRSSVKALLLSVMCERLACDSASVSEITTSLFQHSDEILFVRHLTQCVSTESHEA